MKKLRLLILLLSFILILQGFSFVFHLDLVPTQANATSASGSWQVSAATDDCQRRKQTSDLWSGGGDVGYIDSSNYEYGVGLRFQTVAIPKGAKITLAYLEITCRHASAGGDFYSKISADDADNAATWSTQADFDTRFSTHTFAQANWNQLIAWALDSKYNSSDISSVIQEVVNRGGWSSDNSIALFWEDFGNFSAIYHEGYWYGVDSSKAAKLYVYWDVLSIDSCSATNPDDGSWWLPQYTSYTVEVKVTDPNGVADFNYIDLKLETPTDTYTNAIVRWTEANNSFFIVAGAGYIQNVGASTESTSGNQVILDFKVGVDWDYPLTSDVDCQIYALDDSGNTAGPTKFDLNLGIANTLTTTPTSSDYRQDVGGSVTISGTITFVGPPSNIAITNPYITANGVKIHSSAHTVMNTGSVNPYSIVITLPATVGVDTYHVYIDIALGDFVDKDIGSATANVIRDRLEIWAKDDPEIQVSVASYTHYSDGFLPVIAVRVIESKPISSGDGATYLVTINSVQVAFLTVTYMDGTSEEINMQSTVPVNSVLRSGERIYRECGLSSPFEKEPKSVFVEVGLAVDDSLTNFDQVRIIHKAATLELPSPTFADAPSTAPSNTASDPFPILHQYPFLMPGILLAIAISSIIAFRKKRPRHYVPHRTE